MDYNSVNELETHKSILKTKGKGNALLSKLLIKNMEVVIESEESSVCSHHGNLIQASVSNKESVMGKRILM